MSALNELIRSLRRQFVITIEPSLTGVAGISLAVVGRAARENIDTRVAKIEAARSNLVEAIEAIDELRDKAEENKRDLAALTEKLSRTEAQKASVDMQLSTLRDLAALDTQSVRQSLGIPTRLQIWRERLIAFASGIVASVVASAIWSFFMDPGYRRIWPE